MKNKESNENKGIVFSLPDEAIKFIVSQYVAQQKNVSGLSVLMGIPYTTVEEVIRLFLEWAYLEGYIEDNTLTIKNT